MLVDESTGAEELFLGLVELPRAMTDGLGDEEAERYAAENFLHSGRREDDAERLIDGIMGLVSERGGGWEIEVGFVERSVADSARFRLHDGHCAFRRAVLRRGEETEVVEIAAGGKTAEAT
jgi:hypothetical protein